MAIFTVRQGKRYKATITLNMLERLASNDMIAGKMRNAGFTEVSVTGEGGTRTAVGLWSKPDTTADMPAQIAEVIEA